MRADWAEIDPFTLRKSWISTDFEIEPPFSVSVIKELVSLLPGLRVIFDPGFKW
jgi:hypothetical protein